MIGMLKRPGRTRFLLETPQPIGIGSQGRR